MGKEKFLIFEDTETTVTEINNLWPDQINETRIMRYTKHLTVKGEEQLIFSDCIFEYDPLISRVLPPLKLSVETKNLVFVDNCTFKDNVIIDGTNLETITFDRCTFTHGIKIEGTFKGRIDIINCDFNLFVPDFFGGHDIKHFRFQDNIIKQHKHVHISNLRRIEEYLVRQGNDDSLRDIHRDIIMAKTAQLEFFKRQSLYKLSDNIMYWFFSHLYNIVNRRGTSIARPLICLILLTTGMTYLYDGSIVRNPEYIPSMFSSTWQDHLSDLPAFKKAIAHSLQTTLWPVRFIISNVSPIIEADLTTKALSLLHALFSTILIYLFIASVKVKFKINK